MPACDFVFGARVEMLETLDKSEVDNKEVGENQCEQKMLSLQYYV